MVARYRSLSIPAEPQMSQQFIVHNHNYVYDKKIMEKDQDCRFRIV